MTAPTLCLVVEVLREEQSCLSTGFSSHLELFEFASTPSSGCTDCCVPGQIQFEASLTKYLIQLFTDETVMHLVA